MRFSSTRGGQSGLSLEEALLTGYASDGGMLLPDKIPEVSMETFNEWSKLSYVELMKEILSLFIPEEDIPRKILNSIIDKATSRLTHPDKVPVARLKNGLNILECYHGPTLAFKDLALSCVGNLLEYFLEMRQRHLTILVGTSGDTGSSAIEAVRGLKWVDIIVLLPRGRCTKIQELQMTTVIEDNVHVFRVDGTSDDLDYPIKRCFVDNEFAKKHHLCSVNSVNLCRILAQIVHYFYGYFQVSPSCNTEVEVVVPTGALGNATAGYIASKMGLPIKLVTVTNTNDIVVRVMKNGDCSTADKVIPTLSPAMDIQVAYNLERILCLASNMDRKMVHDVMETFEKDGKVKLPEEVQKKLSETFRSYSVPDSGILSAMKRCHNENNGYLVCPHTATAVAYHYANINRSDHPFQVCIATASAAKFPKAVKLAGLIPLGHEAIQSLEHKLTKCEEMEKGQDWDKILRDKIEWISQKTGK